jgi:PKD domain
MKNQEGFVKKKKFIQTIICIGLLLTTFSTVGISIASTAVPSQPSTANFIHNQSGFIQISGPSIGADGFFYNFTVTATDPGGEQIYYQWNWDDGNSTDWFGPFNSSVPLTTPYAWASHGIYNITATARNAGGNNWSAGHLFSIQQLVNFSNVKLGYIYINLFTYNKSYIYSNFLERFKIVMLFTTHEMNLEAVALDMVETVAFKAENLLTYNTTEFVDNDSSDGFSCVFNISRGVYRLNISAYDANGTLVDKYTLPVVLYRRIGKYMMGPEENLQSLQRLFSRLHH